MRLSEERRASERVSGCCSKDGLDSFPLPLLDSLALASVAIY